MNPLELRCILYTLYTGKYNYIYYNNIFSIFKLLDHLMRLFRTTINIIHSIIDNNKVAFFK